MANRDLPIVITGSTTLDRASADRITAEARRAALGHGGALRELDNALRRTSMSTTRRRQLLIRAWEEAVEGALEDGLISLDEDHALCQYMKHFDISEQDLNANGALTTMVQAAVIRAEPKPARKARGFLHPGHGGGRSQGSRLTTPPLASTADPSSRPVTGANPGQTPNEHQQQTTGKGSHLSPFSGNLTRFPGTSNRTPPDQPSRRPLTQVPVSPTRTQESGAAEAPSFTPCRTARRMMRYTRPRTTATGTKNAPILNDIPSVPPTKTTATFRSDMSA